MAVGGHAGTELDTAFDIIQLDLGEDWIKLALKLGLKHNVVQEILNKREGDLAWKVRTVLEKWRQQQGKAATGEKLLDALKQADRKDLVDRVRDKLYPDLEDTSPSKHKEDTTEKSDVVKTPRSSGTSSVVSQTSQPKRDSVKKKKALPSTSTCTSQASLRVIKNVKSKTGKKTKGVTRRKRRKRKSGFKGIASDVKLALHAINSMQLAKEKLKDCYYLVIESSVKEDLLEAIFQIDDAGLELCKDIIVKCCEGFEIGKMWSSSIYVQMFPETAKSITSLNKYQESGQLATDLQLEFDKIGLNCPLEVDILSMEELEEEVAEIVDEAMDVFKIREGKPEERKLEGEDELRDALLRITAWTGDEDKVRTLLQAGVQVNTANSDGETPLWDAVKAGHSNIVQLLLEEGAETDVVDKNGSSLLFYASALGHIEVCKVLIQHTEANEMEEYDLEETPLWIAIENADSQLLSYLIHEGTDVKKAIGYNPLYLSVEKLMQCEEGIGTRAWQEHVHIFKILVNAGANINATNELGQTSLTSACIKGCKMTVKLLLDNGADPNTADGKGRTPLWTAAMRGNAEIVSILTQTGADMNKTGDMGWTPLWVAAEKGHAKIVKVLTQAGADLNKADDEERTPLLVATLRSHTEVVSILTQAGADLNKTDSTGTTPLWLAAWSGHIDIVRILTQGDADVNKADSTGKTPLWVASLKGNAEIVSILTQAGPDLNETDSKGTTPLWVATESGNAEIVAILIQAGANVNTTDSEQKTPLWIAAQKGHREVVELLIKAGADISLADNTGKTPHQAAIEMKHNDVAKIIVEEVRKRFKKKS